MNIIDIINKKVRKFELTYDEISYIIKGYVNGDVVDYQVSSFLMAIMINGMTNQEIYDLTDIFIKSGDKIDLTNISGIKVDKHSTGGVGDKTTLIIAPIVAALNVPVAKMSGRGLGHTGGTIDKLESIPGFTTEMNFDEFIKQVNEINIALVGQMGNLVPADKKIYALRDVTSTVGSIPLIASSIMSKKIAAGTDKIILDVKVGDGALIKTLAEAKELSEIMVAIGDNYNVETVCILTNMDEPLGNTIGNSLEVREALEVLTGIGPKDITELSIELSTYMVSLGKNVSYDVAKKMVEEVIENKEALNKFCEFIFMQGGDINQLKISKNVYSVKSNKSGYITKIKTEELGTLASLLGAGRRTLTDKIDHEVGFVLNKKVGDYVEKNEELIQVFANNNDINVKEIIDCFKIEEKYKEPNKLIIEIIR